MSIGISKRDLMEDYYLDELSMVLSEYVALKKPPVEEITADNF